MALMSPAWQKTTVTPGRKDRRMESGAVDQDEAAQLRKQLLEQQEELTRLKSERDEQLKLASAALIDSQIQSSQDAEKELQRLGSLVQEGNKNEQQLGKRVVQLQYVEKMLVEKEEELGRLRTLQSAESQQLRFVKEELQEAQLKVTTDSRCGSGFVCLTL